MLKETDAKGSDYINACYINVRAILDSTHAILHMHGILTCMTSVICGQCFLLIRRIFSFIKSKKYLY